MKSPSDNPVLTKSFKLALQIIEFSNELKLGHHYAVENQLIRSGTAIGALIREAQNPESLRDFIHKMKIAAKESEETQYWLDICKNSPVLPDPDSSLMALLQEIQKLLTSIIFTSSQRA